MHRCHACRVVVHCVAMQASLQDTPAAAAPPPAVDDDSYRMAMQASLQDRYMQARQRQVADPGEDDPALRAAIAASLAEQQQQRQQAGLYPDVVPGGGASAPPGYYPR